MALAEDRAYPLVNIKRGVGGVKEANMGVEALRDHS